jgi:hypothetical protein
MSVRSELGSPLPQPSSVLEVWQTESPLGCGCRIAAIGRPQCRLLPSRGAGTRPTGNKVLTVRELYAHYQYLAFAITDGISMCCGP